MKENACRSLGIALKSSVDPSTSVQYACEMQFIIQKARAMIKEMDNTNDLSFIRLRTKKHEVLVIPGLNGSNE